MLELDLVELQRKGRVRVDHDVPADSPLWAEAGVRPRGALAVRLEARRVGSDVLVRGRITVEVEQECRRCLETAVTRIDDAVSLLFRAGLDPAEAERQEVYALPPRARELDLGAPVREHVLLAVPAFAVCREDCRGLCPRCGANLNQGPCGCRAGSIDPRWAALRPADRD